MCAVFAQTVLENLRQALSSSLEDAKFIESCDFHQFHSNSRLVTEDVSLVMFLELILGTFVFCSKKT